VSARRDFAARTDTGVVDTLRQLRSLLAAETAAVRMYLGASRDVADAVLGRRLAGIAERHAAQAGELRRQIVRLSGGLRPGLGRRTRGRSSPT
jgi:rubrerythrin